jgi:hypothetical protein
VFSLELLNREALFELRKVDLTGSDSIEALDSGIQFKLLLLKQAIMFGTIHWP